MSLARHTEHASVRHGYDDEGDGIQDDEHADGVRPSVWPIVRYRQREADAGAAVKVVEILDGHQRRRGQRQRHAPQEEHGDSCLAHAQSLHAEREYYGDEPVYGDECQREDAQLAGERGQEARELTQGTVSPHQVIRDVVATVRGVDAGDDEEIHAHQEVAQRQVHDEERVDLLNRSVIKHELLLGKRRIHLLIIICKLRYHCFSVGAR